MSTGGVGGVQERITEVLAAHRETTKRIEHPWRQGYLLNVEACKGCDWTSEEDGQHPAHVASLVLALFEPEWAVQFEEKDGWYGKDEMLDWSCGHERIYGDASTAAAYAAFPDGGDETFVVSRLVSSWQRES